MNSTANRISISMSFKMGLPNYSSADIRVSFESDIHDSETTEQGYSRVREFVTQKLEEEKKLLAEETQSIKEVVKIKKEEPTSNSSGLSKFKGFKKKTAEETTPKEEAQEEVKTSTAIEPEETATSADTDAFVENMKKKYGIESRSKTEENNSVSRLRR